jgi:hypothetical protein
MLTKRSRLREVALCVSRALESAGIRAVLTGGACASLYSRGSYQSSDLDFIIQSKTSAAALDKAMAGVGFFRRGSHYEHPEAPFFVEFPAGPLAIGRDFRIEPVEFRIHKTRILALSPTDSCRDRLAGFFHWGDRQSLKTAVVIARRQKVDLDVLRRWSAGEGARQAFEEFLSGIKRSRIRRRRTGRAGP